MLRWFFWGFYGDAKESIRHTLWHAWPREWSEVALDVPDVLVKLSGVSLVLFVLISSEGAWSVLLCPHASALEASTRRISDCSCEEWVP